MSRFFVLLLIVLCGIGVAIAVYVAPKYGLSLTVQSMAINSALIAGIITSVGVIVKKGLFPACRLIKDHVTAVSTLVEDFKLIIEEHKTVDLKMMSQAITSIQLELAPNHGSSLRDAVNRIESRGVLAERINWAIRQDGPHAIFRCNQNGENIEVNRTYCRWLGVGADELMAHGWRRFLVGGEKVSEYDREWKQAFKEGREITFGIALMNISGERLDLDVHAYPLVFSGNGSGEYLGLMKIVEAN